MVAETDRDKYCVRQILALYHRQDINYADYFRAAWRFKHRRALGKPRATLVDFAAAGKVSPSTVWPPCGPRSKENPKRKSGRW